MKKEASPSHRAWCEGKLVVGHLKTIELPNHFARLKRINSCLLKAIIYCDELLLLFHAISSLTCRHKNQKS
jgi:hypothetical protein